MLAEISVSVLPVKVFGDPFTVCVSDAKVSEELYVNLIAVVFPPFEFTFAFNTAVNSPTLLAALIVTVGAAIGVKLRIEPYEVPTELDAMTLK